MADSHTSSHSSGPLIDQSDKQEAKAWLEKFARFGLIAKGVVYLIIGTLALRLAVGVGGETTNAKGALESITTQPFGLFLLGLTAIGLVGYAFWKGIQAIQDPDHEGSHGKGLMKRVGYGLSCLAHLGLAIYSAGLIFGSPGGDGGSSSGAQKWTAWLMSQPFGQWLVVAVGVAILIAGLNQLVSGFRGNLRKRMKVGEASEEQLTWLCRMGRCGMIARGVVFGLIGWFVIQAGFTANAAESGGTDKALNWLSSEGPWVLGLTAAGLILYGCFQIALSKFRHVDVE